MIIDVILIFQKLTRSRMPNFVINRILLYTIGPSTNSLIENHTKVIANLKKRVEINDLMKFLKNAQIFDYYLECFEKDQIYEYKKLLKQCNCCKKHADKKEVVGSWPKAPLLQRQNAFRRTIFPVCRCNCKYYFDKLCQVGNPYLKY